jgi:hypothetical protein
VALSSSTFIRGRDQLGLPSLYLLISWLAKKLRRPFDPLKGSHEEALIKHIALRNPGLGGNYFMTSSV